MDVAFPHLGIYIKHLVNHIDVFGFRIAFYGIIIGLGVLGFPPITSFLTSLIPATFSLVTTPFESLFSKVPAFS